MSFSVTAKPLEYSHAIQNPDAITIAMHVVRDRGVKIGYQVTLPEWPKIVSVAAREARFAELIRAAYPKVSDVQRKAIIATLGKEKQIFVKGLDSGFRGLFENRTFFLPAK